MTARGPIRIAVVGVGSLGQHHARVCAGLPDAVLAGVFDTDRDRARSGGRAPRRPCLSRISGTCCRSRRRAVAVPTVDHHRVARALLEAGRMLLVEKPICSTLAEARTCRARPRAEPRPAGRPHRAVQPATDGAAANAVRPRFIEVHRLGTFSPRSLDIDVVLDLMIHDLDIVLAWTARGGAGGCGRGARSAARVDIANARLRFASGLIANLTASRVSAERVRKFRVFSPRTYISLDFAAREAQVHRLADGPSGPEIQSERTAAPDESPCAVSSRHLSSRSGIGPSRWFQARTGCGPWPWPMRYWLGWVTIIAEPSVICRTSSSRSTRSQ